MELQIHPSHRLWTPKSAGVQECQTAVKRLCLTGASHCPLSTSGQCTHRDQLSFPGSGFVMVTTPVAAKTPIPTATRNRPSTHEPAASRVTFPV